MIGHLWTASIAFSCFVEMALCACLKARILRCDQVYLLDAAAERGESQKSAFISWVPCLQTVHWREPAMKPPVRGGKHVDYVEYTSIH
jgi:hypothetical protein